MASTWVCPYCRQEDSTERALERTARLEVGSLTRATFSLYSCHKPSCSRITLVARLHRRNESQVGDQYSLGPTICTWNLIPGSRGRVFPEYIPKFVRDDYEEACAIESLSPKASATLSRRCLQAILRDYFQVAKGSLEQELIAIEKTVHDDALLEALHALREIGNIGAHPERDPNIIVEIEPGEARSMIDLIEIVIDETYIAQHEREEKITRARAIAASKKAAKAQTPEASGG